MKVNAERYKEAVYLCEICKVNNSDSKMIKRKTRKRDGASGKNNDIMTTTKSCCGDHEDGNVVEVELSPQPANSPPGHKYFKTLTKDEQVFQQGLYFVILSIDYTSIVWLKYVKLKLIGES